MPSFREQIRSVLSVSLLPSTILAMNRVVETMGGKGKRSLWVEKVILRALEEDWDIVIVPPVETRVKSRTVADYHMSAEAYAERVEKRRQAKLKIEREKNE